MFHLIEICYDSTIVHIVLLSMISCFKYTYIEWMYISWNWWCIILFSVIIGHIGPYIGVYIFKGYLDFLYWWTKSMLCHNLLFYCCSRLNYAWTHQININYGCRVQSIMFYERILVPFFICFFLNILLLMDGIIYVSEWIV